MRSLYNKYLSRIELCRISLTKTNGEDDWIDIAAADAQQALEYLLKYITEECGVAYNKTHDITNLYNNMKSSSGFAFSDEYTLIGMSNLITKWRTKSIYGQGTLTNKLTIENCLELTEKLDKEWIMYKDDKIQNKHNSRISDLLNKAEGN